MLGAHAASRAGVEPLLGAHAASHAGVEPLLGAHAASRAGVELLLGAHAASRAGVELLLGAHTASRAGVEPLLGAHAASRAGMEKDEIRMRFRDRKEAGRLLAQSLVEYSGRPDVIVLALPRGGVPVADEVAEALNAPLDILVVRKLGVPGQEELALGAIAAGGAHVLNENIVRYLGITDETIAAIAQRELRELERREQLYRGNEPALDLKGRTVILVDDGLATGSSMRAAVAAVRGQTPAHIVVAVPVAARSTCELFNQPAEGMVCVCAEAAEPFYAVGLWYEHFDQTTDQEVRELLNRARRRTETEARSVDRFGGGRHLTGDLMEKENQNERPDR